MGKRNDNNHAVLDVYKIFTYTPYFSWHISRMGIPKDFAQHSRMFMRQYEMMTRIGIKTFLTIFVINVFNRESTGIKNLRSFQAVFPPTSLLYRFTRESL